MMARRTSTLPSKPSSKTALPGPRQNNPASMQPDFLGIEIGGTKLQIVRGDRERILRRWRFEVEPSKGAEGIRRQIEGALAEIGSAEQPAAVAVGFGGPVDFRSGRICRSHQ